MVVQLVVVPDMQAPFTLTGPSGSHPMERVQSGRAAEGMAQPRGSSRTLVTSSGCVMYATCGPSISW